MTHVAQRIGVFGGAFDPPHLGHVALAQAAVAQLGLSRLLVVPTGQAAHKEQPLSNAHHRLRMCELAFATIPEVRVDPRETLRSLYEARVPLYRLADLVVDSRSDASVENMADRVATALLARPDVLERK